jgi:hypothetical protein
MRVPWRVGPQVTRCWLEVPGSKSLNRSSTQTAEPLLPDTSGDAGVCLDMHGAETRRSACGHLQPSSL